MVKPSITSRIVSSATRHPVVSGVVAVIALLLLVVGVGAVASPGPEVVPASSTSTYSDPTATQTPLSTPEPTAVPTPVPTAVPTPVPTVVVTPVPTAVPAPRATAVPTPRATAAPRATAVPAAPAPVADNCTAGYDPCIAPGPDVDCQGGSGNGPRYVSGPVRVTGSDPYGLDADHDGYGCE